jgi:hypothetical protein
VIEISEVINWLRDDSVVSRRGPNAIVVVADFYDYEMTTQIFQLPEDKDDAINQINNILDDLVDPDAEDNSVDIVCQETTKSWDRAMIENQGKTKVVNEVMDLLKKNWDSVWKISGWQSGNENWEVKWERVNFV